jgi:protochlorophyllide reductase
MAVMQARVKERAKAEGSPETSAPPQMTMKSVAAGAATQIFAATSPDLAAHGGAYLADCQLGIAGGNAGVRGVAPHAADPAIARRLWMESEKWVGQVFDA